MKVTKILSVILVLCLILASFAACSAGSDAKAYDRSKAAFNLITDAYIATNDFSSDIYEAWNLGVNHRSSYDSDSEFKDFADEMSIERKYIEQAIAELLGKETFSSGDWSMMPYLYNGSYFSAWVSIISKAYECSGQVAQIEAKLNDAMALMKELDNKYSDYTHYPTLKNYFTNTIAFLDFCRNPEGSFDQVVETFNTYRNNAREYFFDLNYVFTDSLNGMEAKKEEDTPETTGAAAQA